MEVQEPTRWAASTTILMLGDGDFTFSLDLARQFLTEDSPPQSCIHLIATGIDKLDDLKAKYKDAAFVLNQLIKSQYSHLSITVCHGVDAILGDARIGCKADLVIFNHPHLGIEDAVIHSLFLSHLFFAVDHHWMKPNGVFYLTLAKGQYERWDCDKAATRHGMKLASRATFSPPAVDSAYYEMRRHQSGKSFRARRALGSSETFSFVRRGDRNVSTQQFRPIWVQQRGPAAENTRIYDDTFQCPYCFKAFKEKRSLRNHCQLKHPQGNNRTLDENHTCPHCPSNVHRSFPSQQSLNDHIKAKHTGILTYIPADRSLRGNERTGDESSCTNNEVVGSCEICGYLFRTQLELLDHLSLFRPTSTVVKSDVPMESGVGAFHCSFCARRFRERRAQMQHENACRDRETLVSVQST